MTTWVLFMLCTLSGKPLGDPVPEMVWVRPSMVLAITPVEQRPECSRLHTSFGHWLVQGTPEKVREKLDAK